MMKFRRRVWKTGTGKVVTAPRDLEVGEEYEFELVGKTGDSNATKK